MIFTSAQGITKYISIHAPHAGRDSIRSVLPCILPVFQSTRPMRGATWNKCSNCFAIDYFNPRAPCGARLLSHSGVAFFCKFQSTRPMRGATIPLRQRYRASKFQSTRPMRGATGEDYEQAINTIFQSTRPMRGATASAFLLHFSRGYFNPRAPCGARLNINQHRGHDLIFQSTRPMRGATKEV